MFCGPDQSGTANADGLFACSLGVPMYNIIVPIENKLNSAAIGSPVYVTSTEVDAGNVWAVDALTKATISISKTTAAFVRCVRRPFGPNF